MNNTWGMIKKNIATYVTTAILCALVAFVGNMWLGGLLGLLIFAGFAVMQYGEGCERGERACTLRDTVDKMRKEGREPEEVMLKQLYDPSMAVKAFLISSLPLTLLALVNLILADPHSVSESILGTVTRIVFFPAAWLTRLLAESVGIDYAGTMQAITGVVGSLTRGGIDFGAAIGSLSGVADYAVAYDLYYLTILRIGYIVVSFIIPAAMMIGYMRGPRLREQRLKDIAKGTRKKARKLKVFNNKPRQRKQMKPEV